MTINQKQNFRTSWENTISLLEKIGGTKTGKVLAKQGIGKIALMLAGITTIATPAHALRINATYSSGISLEDTQIIQKAISTWEGQLTDPVTLNIDFKFSNDIPVGVLGGSLPTMIKVNYKDYLTALGQDGSSDDDRVAVQSQLVDSEDQNLYSQYLAGSVEREKFQVKKTKVFDLVIDERFNPNNPSASSNGFLDNNGNRNNQKIWLTRSNAKALGLIKPDPKLLDASIVLSNRVNWDMNSSNGISADAYDFHTVVLHEIGHALGFVSGADAMEFLSMSSTGMIDDDDLSYVTPMNTYMYSAKSATLGAIDLRLGNNETERYMSLDGGVTPVTDSQGNRALFSTGGLSWGGDGYQTSHWKDFNTPLGIMNPTLEMGQSIAISELDRRLLDVMGWDLNDRREELMKQVGLDEKAFEQSLTVNHQTVVDTYGAVWESYNPGDSIRKELAEQLWNSYRDIEPDIEEQLLKLKADLSRENDPIKREQKRVETLKRIWDLIKYADEDLKHFADDMRDVNVKVRDWLNKDIGQLSDRLQQANGVQIAKLQRILANATQEQRTIWENKIRQALGLFLDNPEKALEMIHKTNDFHSPMGGGTRSSGGGWGGWWQSSVDEGQDLALYNYNTAAPGNSVQPAQSVPEPSSLIALIALGGIGLLTRKRDN